MSEKEQSTQEEKTRASGWSPEMAEWISGLNLPEKKDLLFELFILLKGLDRFFNIQNLPLANMDHVITFNFLEELEIVHQFVKRAVDLSAVLLSASRRGDHQFQYYVETKLLGDYQRSLWRERVMEQRTPQDSLFVLHSTFLNFREIIGGVLELKRVPYPLFFNLGSLITREIAQSRFFNPSPSLRFRPEYDRIANRKIGRIIRGIADRPLQRQTSIIILAFNRLLQYLHFIHPHSDSPEVLKSSLLFFSLIYSESKYLMEYLEKYLPATVQTSPAPLTTVFLETCDSLGFQLQMEMKKIHSGELLNLSKQRKVESLRTAVENSHGILLNFFQQSVIQLLKVFSPQLEGEEIFPAFISRRKQSIKLREDLALLQMLMDKFEEITETTEAGNSLDTYLKYLVIQKDLVARLRRDIVPLMRYQDLIEFEKYFNFIEELTLDDLHLMDKLDRFKMESKFFKIFVETTLSHIGNRSELQALPLNPRRVEKALKRFIAEYLK